METGTVLWICGKATAQLEDGGIAWEVQGIYDTEAAAVASCITPWYFVGPEQLNVGRPHDTQVWEGCYYPLAGEIGDWTEEELVQGYRSVSKEV